MQLSGTLQPVQHAYSPNRDESPGLAVAGVPAARVWPIDQPLEVDGHPVTFWRYITGRRGGPEDVRVLGRLLRQVHDLPAPDDFRLPAQDPLQRVRPRI